MNVEEFVKLVWRGLGPIRSDDPDDLNITNTCIEFLHDKQFTVADAVSYCSCLEHFDPHVPEDYAIAQMERLMLKYDPNWRA